MYIDRKYGGNILPYPQQDINPALKNKEWVRKNIEYIYSQYINGQSDISLSDKSEIERLRKYKDGDQDADKYKDIILGSKEEWGGNRMAYNSINYEDIYNPFPSVLQKMHGIFDEQEYEIDVSAIDEHSAGEKAESEFKAMLESKMIDPYEANGLPSAPKETATPPITSDNEMRLIQSMGGIKMPYEVGVIRLSEQVEEESNYRFIRRKILEDLITYNRAFVESYVEGDRIKYKYIDMKDVIIEYSRSDHYQRSRYAGYVDEFTIGELRALGCDMSEKELRDVAKSFKDFNNIKDSFRKYDAYDTSTESYGYDDWRIPVVKAYWKSIDSKYKVRREGSNGEIRVYDGRWGKTYPNSHKKKGYKKSTEVIYGGWWIVGTDHVFSGDDFDEKHRLYNMQRNERDEVSLPIKGIRIEGKSMLQRSRYILDMIAITELKLQGAMASAAPAGISVDISGLENVTYASGQKMKPRDVLRMYRQTGDSLFRSSPLDYQINYSSGRPITPTDGGIGRLLGELLELGDKYRMQLVEATGINEMTISSSTGQDTPVGHVEASQASSNTLIRDLQNAEIAIKKQLILDIICKAMILFKYNKSILKSYSTSIHKGYADAIKTMASGRIESPVKWGFKISAKPTEQQRLEVLGVLKSALTTGKSGNPVIRGSEYLYMVELLRSNDGLRIVRAILEQREKDDEMRAQQQQQAIAQQQAQAAQQQQQMKMQGEMAKQEQKSKLDLQTYKQKSDIDIQKTEQEKGIDIETDAARMGLGLDHDDN